MGAIWLFDNPPGAGWSTRAAEGAYAANVLRSRVVGEFGKVAWTWSLAFMPAPEFGGEELLHIASHRDAFWVPAGKGPEDVLRTLASFLSTWSDARCNPASENYAMFPEACEPFLGCVEEFFSDVK